MNEVYDWTELRRRLADRADDEYRVFSMKGIPSERPFIGVRIPQIREIVTKIPMERVDELLVMEPVAFEEVIARGFLISRLSYDKMLAYFDSQVENIDDWCACDTFCSSLRQLIKKHRAEFLDNKIEPLLKSDQEFPVRIGLVLLKCYYVDSDHLNLIFDRVENLAKREEYYIRMAIAWLMAEYFIKFPDETFAFLKVSRLPKWTYNKTISKICDSYRVDSEMKDALRGMRK